MITIASQDIYSPQNFLELITGKTIIIGSEPFSTIGRIVEKVNKEYGEKVISRWRLDELDKVSKEEFNSVVLVGPILNSYYWYSLPPYKEFEYPDSIIFNIEEEKIGDKPIKFVHFLGYHYGCPDEPLYNHKFEEYNGFNAFLSDVLKEGLSNFEQKYSEFAKQSTVDCTYPMIREMYNTYDNGHKPKVISEKEFNKEIPCGCYILKNLL